MVDHVRLNFYDDDNMVSFVFCCMCRRGDESKRIDCGIFIRQSHHERESARRSSRRRHRDSVAHAHQQQHQSDCLSQCTAAQLQKDFLYRELLTAQPH